MAAEPHPPNNEKEKEYFDASQIERVMTPDELQKDAQDYNRIDVSHSPVLSSQSTTDIDRPPLRPK